MALHDGFFDSDKEVYEETGKYDRAYGPDDFTTYFSKTIGSGVCIHGNTDSFFVRIEDGNAVVSPGYLFINGYWLRNDADHKIQLPGSGTFAIVARLNAGLKTITLDAVSVSRSYPNSLVLAIVNAEAGTADDTRYNIELCGVIDTAGGLSSKTEWAINYIDTEIETKLAQVEQEIAAQDANLNAKITEVQAVVNRVLPPPVGTIQFSASQDIDDTWLPCDGRFINERDYPELVEALGKLTPSADKFKVISEGEIGTEISNGVVYGGRMWVFSYSTKKLYGVDVEGNEPVKEIELTSNAPQFSDFIAPSDRSPIALSIVPHKSGSAAKLFLAQIIKSGSGLDGWLRDFLIFGAEFSGEESALEMEPPFTSISKAGTNPGPWFDPEECVPYVVSETYSGVESYYSLLGGWYDSSTSEVGALTWTKDSVSASLIRSGMIPTKHQRISYNKKSKNEIVLVEISSGYNIKSAPNETFSFKSTKSYSSIPTRSSTIPLNVAGGAKVLFSFDLNLFPWVSFAEDNMKSVKTNIATPSGSKVFVDAGAYLWSKGIYMIFVGTGIIFSRTLEEGSFGYLDTTETMGVITQYGYLDYSEDGNALYILGQDTDNRVKVAKIVLNTLYNYANDGAWLPSIAADGVPAYIKAVGETKPAVKTLKVTVKAPSYTPYMDNVAIVVNGEIKTIGTYKYEYPDGTGTISVGMIAIKNTDMSINLKAENTTIANMPSSSKEGTTKTVQLSVSPYIESGLTLQITN